MAQTQAPTVQQGPSVAAVPSPTVSTAPVAAAQPAVAANATPHVQAETYEVVVKAPPAHGMLAYLVGPGAHIVLQGIDLSQATVAQEAGNLRISLPNGAEVLLLDFVASAKDAHTVVEAEGATLPAQKLLASLDHLQTADANANVEPAAGPNASNGGGNGSEGGYVPPVILGTGVGEGVGVFSSVIDPFALPIARDAIIQRDYPYENGLDPNTVDARDDVATLVRNTADNAVDSTIINVLGNDVDPQGDSFSITTFTQPTIGSVVKNADGTFTYTADASMRDAYTTTFTYTITDSKGATDTATVTVNVGADFNNVDAVDDTATLVRNTANNAVDSTVITVLGNDKDPQSDAFSITGFTQPAIGSVVKNADGTFTYTADATRLGAYDTTFTYTITDSKGATDTATVTVHVGDDYVVTTQLPPVAHDDTFSTAINQPLKLDPAKLLVNDTDPEGDPLTIVSVQGAEHGTVAIVNGQVVFTPATDYTGPASFSYTISDGKGGTSTADVTIQIDPTFPGQNTVVAADDAYTVVPGVTKVFNVLTNDSDPQGDALVPGSVRLISQPSIGTATVNADGTISFVAPANNTSASQFVSFEYEVSDDKGAKDTATVTVEILPSANSVIAVDDTGEIIPAGTAKVFNVVANDVDPQGDAFAITRIVSGPAQGSATFDAAKGTITYISAPSTVGYDSTIVYEITDARGATSQATLTVHVEPTNNVSAVDDTADMMAGQQVNIEVLKNDFDAQGDSFHIVAGSATQPHLAGSSTARGSVSINPDGTITFTDDAGARDSAVVEFTYKVVDSKGAEDTAVVRVTIGTAANGVDANNDTLSVEENSGKTDITSTLLKNDFDPQGDTFKITGVSSIDPAKGTLTLDSAGHVFFTPATDYHGKVEFTYTLTDSKGATDTAVVVLSVNEAISTTLNAGDDYFSTPFNTNLTITPADLLKNDNDPQGTTLASANIISHSTPLHGTLTVDANGNFVYNPDDTFKGEDTFTYTIKDAQGDLATATVHINVADPLPQDHPVDAVNDDVYVRPTDTVTVNVLTNDSAPDGGLAFVRVVGSLPAGVTDLGGGRFSYTAPAGAGGSDVSFQYEVRDVDGDTDIATVTFHVTNNAVDAVNDTATAVASHPQVIAVLGNDTDPQGDTFSISGFTQPAHGTVVQNADGTFTYTAANGYTGADSFTYTITDSKGATDTATVSITVSPNTVDAVNDETTLVRNSANNTVDIKVIDVLGNDTDPQGDAFSISGFTQPAIGSVVKNADGTFTYTADASVRGAYDTTFTYTITDSKGATDTATVTVHVGADFNNVDAVNDTATAVAGHPQVIAVLGNDTDPQGDTFSISGFTQGSHGTVVQNTDGTFTYTAANGYTGVDTFTYTITDSKGATDTATVTVNVAPNSVDAVNDTANAVAAHPQVINVLANDFDPQGDTFSITSFTQPTHGALVQNPNGTFTYTPVNGYTGADSFTYTITDSKGATDTATVNISVAPNTVVAVDDSVTLTGSFVNIVSGAVTGGSGPTVVNVLANDYDPQGDSFTVTRIVSGPSVGGATLNANGTITYTPVTSFDGYTTSLVYEIVDSLGAHSTATLTINVGASTWFNQGSGFINGGGGGDCPLTIDLNGDGIQIANLASSTAHFDLNGDGVAEHTAWVTGKDDAILAIDRNGNGTIDGINEVFGGKNLDGFTDLAAKEDTNHDGVIDAKDADFAQLKLWIDANHDGVSQLSELHSLAEYSITSLNTTSDSVSIRYGDAYISNTGDVTFADGSTRHIANSVFYTNGGTGELSGTANDDVLIYSNGVTHIDGGLGHDTLQALTASTITLNAGNTHNLDAVNLLNGGDADILNININDVLAMTHDGILKVTGDAVDHVVLTGDATQGANVTDHGTTYASYSAANGGTVLVELGVAVTDEQHHTNV